MSDDDNDIDQDAFGPAPRDIVHEPDPHVADRLRAANGTNVTLVTPLITEDPDGVPIAVGEQRLTGTLYVPRELWDWKNY